MEDLATSRQLNYLAYLVKGFEAPDGLTKKAASILIGKALKEAKGSNKKDDGKKTEAKQRETTGDGISPLFCAQKNSCRY